jgi:hypothetical protein
MRKLTTLFFFLSAIIVSAHSQAKNGRVTGDVKGPNQKGIEAATVSLLRAKDSALVKLSLTGKQGDFEFEKLADGKYIVSISAVGLAKAYGQPFELSSVNNNINLGTFELTQQTAVIGGVTVTAKRPLIENKIDRTVVNVESSITNGGLSAMDVLEKSPGITIDNDGNISLKGQHGVIILIDGKPLLPSSTRLRS